jgi:hypothetical protein
MDKDFLADYSAKELEEDDKLASLIEHGQFEVAREFSRRRIGRLGEPVGRSARGLSLWPQIPFFGTIIVSLSPFAEPSFKLVHGFSTSEIDRLVDFARETNRVAFVLNDDPKEFAGLDFLDPIFTEMQPTVDNTLPDSLFTQRLDEYMIYRDEFDTLARANFYQYMSGVTQVMRESLGPSADRSTSWASNLMHTYACLGILGYEDIKQAIADCMVESPQAAHAMLLSLDILLIGPTLDPYRAIPNVSHDELKSWEATTRLQSSGDDVYQRMLKQTDRIRFPSEIGKFLMTKLQKYPETLDACRFVCGLYDQHELRRVVNSLQRAISKKDYSAIESEANRLSMALDHIWVDSEHLERKRNAISAGMTVGLGLVGSIVSGPIGPAIGGLLGGLGFQVLEQILQVKTDSISDSLSRWITPDYLVNIYEFKRDHGIKS